MASIRNENCYTIDRCLYYHRKCLSIPNINIWRIKKEKTESKQFEIFINLLNKYVETLDTFFIIENNIKYVMDKELFINYWISEWFDTSKDINEFMNLIKILQI